MRVIRQLETDDTIEVLPAHNRINYPAVVQPVVPARPEPEVRTVGLLFKRVSPADARHADRLWDIYHVAIETELAEQCAGHAEVEGIRVAIDKMQQIERMVDVLPPSVTALLAADMGADATNRFRVRHARQMDNFDTHVLNLRRR